MCCKDCREIEGKFSIDSFDVVKDNLKKSGFTKTEVYTEFNKVFISQNDSFIRIRSIDNTYFLTIKGDSSLSEYNNRFEFEREITNFERLGLESCFNFSIFYSKVREIYLSSINSNIVICLDTFSNSILFVEIEASNENEITHYKELLGIKSNNINTPYWKLIK